MYQRIRPRELVQPFAGGGVDTGDGVLIAMAASEGQEGSTEGVGLAETWR